VVYLAKHIESGKYCALKQLDKNLIKKEGKIENVLLEKRILTSATSPFILKATWAFQDSQFAWLTLQYCPGGDLQDLLETIRFEEKEVVLYFAEMIMGVLDLHIMGYIHRDLKPSNFLIDRTGHIKLADFGLATSIRAGFPTRNDIINPGNLYHRERHIRRVIRPTPEYMSPEILAAQMQFEERKHYYGPEVDWWSLGCVFYEMIFGTPPLGGGRRVEELFSHRDLRVQITFILQKNREHFSPACYSLLTGFLCEPTEILLDRDIDKIKLNPFFKGINWLDLRSMTPPFIPQTPPEISIMPSNKH